MDLGEIIKGESACTVCGEFRIIVKAGFQYCFECGLRISDSQALDFTQEYVQNVRFKKKKFKEITIKYGELWTSWHIYNLIMVGLVEELSCCSSRGRELKHASLKIWGNFLQKNKIAFFQKKPGTVPPRLPPNFINRDLVYLYDMKKPKKKLKKVKVIEEKTKNKRRETLAINRCFERITDSQPTQQTISSTLEDLKKSESVMAKPSSISITLQTRKLLKRKLTREQLELHIKQGYCGPGCRCLHTKLNYKIELRKKMLTWMGMYSILCLALRIIDDEVHVGDVIRWCREGNLSYGTYDHFIPDDLIFRAKEKNFRLRCPIKIAHHRIRMTANQIANHISLDSIRAPDINTLIRRYIIELELPMDLIVYIDRLVYKFEKIADYNSKSVGSMPNYEAMAMSYIIVSLKILFGFDGKVETDTSDTISKINQLLSLPKSAKIYPRDFTNPPKAERMFVLREWMEYLEYRKICIAEYHYPTRVRLYPDAYDKPELFLHHAEVTRKSLTKSEPRNQIALAVRSIMERIEDSRYTVEQLNYPKFYSTLYPMTEYVETLLNWTPPAFKKEILEEDFSVYCLNYTVDPDPLRRLVRRSGSKLDVSRFRCIEYDKDLGSRHFGIRNNLPGKMEDVAVSDCTMCEWIDMNTLDDVKNTLDEFYKEREFGEKFATLRRKINDCSEADGVCLKLTTCYNKYWIRHYNDFWKKFNVSTFRSELDKYPRSFAWLLKHCADMVEMDEVYLYYEVCEFEKKILKFNARKKLGSVKKTCEVKVESDENMG